MVDLSDPGIRRACKYGRIVLNLMDVREVEGVVRLRDAALMLKRPRVSYSVLRVACAAMGLSHGRWRTEPVAAIREHLASTPTWAEIRVAGATDRAARRPGRRWPDGVRNMDYGERLKAWARGASFDLPARPEERRRLSGRALQRAEAVAYGALYGTAFPVRIDEGPPHTARKLQSLYWWTLFLQRDFLGEELFAVLLWEGLSVRRLFARALRGADELLTCCRPKFQQDFFRHRRGLRWRFPRAWEVLHPKSTERDPEPEALEKLEWWESPDVCRCRYSDRRPTRARYGDGVIWIDAVCRGRLRMGPRYRAYLQARGLKVA